ncbi:hypothetical protein C0995_008446 [Termitomyces sp. Mi166|nr:hypothetical protein C0995_008446 [Termitomyces sp. Mi166\
MESALLPDELLENIILEAWSSLLSNNDRIELMTSFLLVNSTWKALFTRISFKDVHIPSPSYLARYMAALAGYPPLILDGQSPPHKICQSITIKIPPAITIGSNKEYDDRQENPMGETLSNLLYYLDGIIDVPNLRTLRIEYENMGFDDIFDCWRFAHFPAPITNLEISFSFDRDTSALGDVLRVIHQSHEHPPLEEIEVEAYSLRNIKRLSVSGASDAFVADITACCPNAECVSIWCPTI